MKYWVYENWIHKYAKIHNAECRWCNDGKGCHKDSTDNFGRWLGPFESKQEAEIAARRLKERPYLIAPVVCSYCPS